MLLESHLARVVANENVDQSKEFGVEVYLFSELGKYPEIAFPLFPSNFMKIPDVKQIIEVVLPADTEDEVGINEFAHHIFYTGRVFDRKDGKPPAELLKNYPKRCGFWTKDGSIIYIDETKGSAEIMLRLGDGKGNAGNNFISIKDGRIAIVDTKTVLGAESASESIVKGTQMNSDLNTFYGAWSGALTTLSGFTATEPGAAAYATSTNTALGILISALLAWLSTKHFVDS